MNIISWSSNRSLEKEGVSIERGQTQKKDIKKKQTV